MQILFIRTGGTIDKDYPRNTGGHGFEINEPAIIKILSRVNPAFEFKVISLLEKDSLEITQEDRKMLVEFCSETKYDKIIITHGTDTIIETAEALSVIKNKSIILTGAFRPEKFKDTDADFNAGTAVGAIQYISPGIYIALNGIVFPWNEVRRNLKTGQFVNIRQVTETERKKNEISKKRKQK